MNEYETAVVNEPSVFEPLKFYCMFTVDVEQQYNQPTKVKFIAEFNSSLNRSLKYFTTI